jgi:hypothetical protein
MRLGQSYPKHLAAALLPVVRDIAAREAARELEAAADALALTPLSQRESGVITDFTAGMHSAGQIVRLCARALGLDPTHGKATT